MNLAVESYRLWEYLGISGAVKAAKEAGFDAMDWSFYWKAAPELCGDDYLEKAAEIRNALEKYDMKCTQAHAPFDFAWGMKQDASCFEYLSICRAIEACGIIGIDRIVVHGVAVPETAVSKQNLEFNYDYYKKLEPLCEKYGVGIAVENLASAFTYPDLLNEIIRRLDSPYFTALVDVGHAWLRANIQPGEFIRRLTPGTLRGLHIHDNHGAAYGVDEHLAPYLGTLDFDDMLKALKETGYDGDFTLEVPRFLKMYADHGLLIPALKFSCEVGRKMMSDLEAL